MTTNNKTKPKETEVEIKNVEISNKNDGKELVVSSESAITTPLDSSPLMRPTIQAVRGNGKYEYGYFISLENIISSQWMGELKPEDLVEYKYESDNIEEGLIFQSLKMLVYPQSPLYAYDRAKSKEEKETIIIGAWDKETHGSDSNAGNLRFYQIILLDAKNNPLHKIPFAYKAKGANQATFATNWQKLVSKVTFFYCLANKLKVEPQPFPFNTLCVFAFKCEPRKTETKEQAIALKVTEHEVPTSANWKNYYVGDLGKVWNPTETIALGEGSPNEQAE